MVSPAFPEQEYQQWMGSQMRPQPSGLVSQQQEMDFAVQQFNEMQPSAYELSGQVSPIGKGVLDFFGGLGGGIADVGKRLFSPQTYGETHMQPYNPMFQPESMMGQLGRGVVSGFTFGYPEGPIDHQFLSGPEQALMFADLVDPSGVGGDILRPLAKAIPEGTLAGLAGIIPSANRRFFQKSKVVDKEGGLKPLFHGTRSEIQEVESGFGSSGGLYGPGFYMTESSDVAGGYAGFNQRIMADFQAQEDALVSEIEQLRLTLKKPNDTSAIYQDWLDKDIAALEKLRTEGIFAQFPNLTGGNVNAFYANFEKPFDIDASVDREMLDSILKMANTELDRETLIDVLVTQKSIKDFSSRTVAARELEGLYGKELRDIASQVIETNGDLWNVMKDLKYAEIQDHGFAPHLIYEDLIGAGYDSITHTGGAITGTPAHKVWIDIDPDKGRTIPWSVAEGKPTERLVPPVGGGSGTIPPQGAGGVLPSVQPGTPTVVYTGADEPFTQFDISKIGTRTDAGFAGRGAYTTADPAKAARWGEHVMETVIPSDSKLLPISGVTELYSKYGLKEMTPAQLDLPLEQRNLIYTENVNAFAKKMTDQGYDGIAWTLSDGDTQYVLFNPEKYKFNPVSQ